MKNSFKITAGIMAIAFGIFIWFRYGEIAGTSISNLIGFLAGLVFVIIGEFILASGIEDGRESAA